MTGYLGEQFFACLAEAITLKKTPDPCQCD